MKRLILSGLILLLSAAIAPAVQAQMTSTALPNDTQTLVKTATPVDLVSLAYQGFFESEGIPKFSGLIYASESGQVTAEDLVRVAIGMHRLSPDAINDQGFLAQIKQQLDVLYAPTEH
jgi:hypothetical protein